MDRYRNFDPCHQFEIPEETNKPVMNKENLKDQNPEPYTLVVASSKPLLRGFVTMHIAINDEQGNKLSLHYGGSWIITITYRLFDEIWYGIRHIYGEAFSEGLKEFWDKTDTKYFDLIENRSTSPKQHRELLDSIKLFISEYERRSNNRSVEPIDRNIQTLIRTFEWNIGQLDSLIKEQ